MALGLQAAAINAGIVAVVCGIIAGAAWRAMLRTGNKSIGFVIAAFILLSLKNLLKALTLTSVGDETANQEFAFSLFDLVAVGLIAWPLLSVRGT